MTKQFQTSWKKTKRKRTCKICKKKYIPDKQFQVVCGDIQCAIAYGKKKIASNNRKAKKEYRANDKSFLMKQCQDLANKIGRARSNYLGFDYCVTCGKRGEYMHGGHFLPTSVYSAIRFDVSQIFNQCYSCNCARGGMPKEYREFMIYNFGLEKVERLEATKRITRNYTIEYLKKYKRVMKKYLRRLEERLIM